MVYLLSGGIGDGTDLLGVFSTLALAQQFGNDKVKTYHQVHIEEWDVDGDCTGFIYKDLNSDWKTINYNEQT